MRDRMKIMMRFKPVCLLAALLSAAAIQAQACSCIFPTYVLNVYYATDNAVPGTEQLDQLNVLFRHVDDQKGEYFQQFYLSGYAYRHTGETRWDAALARKRAEGMRDVLMTRGIRAEQIEMKEIEPSVPRDETGLDDGVELTVKVGVPCGCGGPGTEAAAN